MTTARQIMQEFRDDEYWENCEPFRAHRFAEYKSLCADLGLLTATARPQAGNLRPLVNGGLPQMVR
jgi:hypothetical protein